MCSNPWAAFFLFALAFCLFCTYNDAFVHGDEGEKMTTQRRRKKTDDDDEEEDPTHSDEEGLPKVTDQEYHSKIPPTYMRCDCCSATAFWIHRAFKLAHKENFLKKMKTDVIYDTVDDICLPKTFSRTYGIKRVNGKHRLSGGGLKWFYDSGPTVGTLMPGQWLNYQCRQTQGEITEEVLYDLFWKYHVKMGHDTSDIPFFREVCINRMKLCTEEEALASYDGLEAKHLKEPL